MNANYFIVRLAPGHLWVFAWNRFGAGAELVVVLREVNRKTEMNQRFRENRHIFFAYWWFLRCRTGIQTILSSAWRQDTV